VLPVDQQTAIPVSFASIDAFHPDQLHDRLDYVANSDETENKAAWMNWVLHHADFQALESVWRGLEWLLARTSKINKVEVVLLDISLPELAHDLKSSENLAATGLCQLLIDKAARGQHGSPWAAFLGVYSFEPTPPYIEVLGRLAKIAATANAPFFSTLTPRVLDDGFAMSPQELSCWQSLRQLPEAAYLGLAVPRFLLRVPYGDNTQSIEKFPLEETTSPPDRSHYLWGNPAFGCAALLAQAFQKAGWSCKPGAVLELDNLSVHAYSVDGDEVATLGEAYLARPQSERLTKLGIMSFLGVRDKGALQLFRFQSVAQPAEGQTARDLGGHWGQAGMGPVQQAKAPIGPKVSVVAPTSGSTPGAAAASPMQALSSAPRATVSTAPASMMQELAASAPAAAGPSGPSPMQDFEASMPPPAPAPADPAAAPAEEEMDPELAALLKSLE
jgi:type VI secretion system protein ImpC